MLLFVLFLFAAPQDIRDPLSEYADAIVDQPLPTEPITTAGQAEEDSETTELTTPAPTVVLQGVPSSARVLLAPVDLGMPPANRTSAYNISLEGIPMIQILVPEGAWWVTRRRSPLPSLTVALFEATKTALITDEHNRSRTLCGPFVALGPEGFYTAIPLQIRLPCLDNDTDALQLQAGDRWRLQSLNQTAGHWAQASRLGAIVAAHPTANPPSTLFAVILCCIAVGLASVAISMWVWVGFKHMHRRTEPIVHEV